MAALDLGWEALEAKQAVNGVTSKKAWAKKFGISLRYCQYLVRDGSRKNQPKANANSVRVLSLKEDMIASFPVYVGDNEEKSVMKFKIIGLPEGDAEFYGDKKAPPPQCPKDAAWHREKSATATARLPPH